MRATIRFGISGFLVVACMVTAGCRDDGSTDRTPDVAVTNSYLQCIVRDLWGRDAGILCLAPPGMCPGHFDLSPAQVTQLAGCRMLLLFDFQQSVERTLGRLRDKGLKTHLVQVPAGLCIPETYLALCQQVSRVLAKEYPERAGQFDQRLSVIRDRLEKLGSELKARVLESEAASAKVLVSSHQAGFVRWLGLEPVATFVGSDVETVSNIDHCLKRAAGQSIRYIIANQQEGTALAEALAERLRATAVVFSNFPQPADDGAGFDQLLRDNVRRLTEAVVR